MIRKDLPLLTVAAKVIDQKVAKVKEEPGTKAVWSSYIVQTGDYLACLHKECSYMTREQRPIRSRPRHCTANASCKCLTFDLKNTRKNQLQPCSNHIKSGRTLILRMLFTSLKRRSSSSIIFNHLSAQLKRHLECTTSNIYEPFDI